MRRLRCSENIWGFPVSIPTSITVSESEPSEASKLDTISSMSWIDVGLRQWMIVSFALLLRLRDFVITKSYRCSVSSSSLWCCQFVVSDVCTTAWAFVLPSNERNVHVKVDNEFVEQIPMKKWRMMTSFLPDRTLRGVFEATSERLGTRIQSCDSREPKKANLHSHLGRNTPRAQIDRVELAYGRCACFRGVLDSQAIFGWHRWRGKNLRSWLTRHEVRRYAVSRSFKTL